MSVFFGQRNKLPLIARKVERMMSKSTQPKLKKIIAPLDFTFFFPFKVYEFFLQLFYSQAKTFSLQNCKRRKGTMRLRLLLTYVQNGIEEPWQRIPSIIALFAAEASFILLEPSHHHYAAISKFLVQSTRMNRKVNFCDQCMSCVFWHSNYTSYKIRIQREYVIWWNEREEKRSFLVKLIISKSSLLQLNFLCKFQISGIH